MAAPRPPSLPDVALVALLLVSIAAAGGLMAVYATGGQPQLEGLCLGVALGGIAGTLGWWGTQELPGRDAVEHRPPLPSTEAEIAAFRADFEAGERPVTRRRLIVGLLGTAFAALGAAAVFPIRSLGPGPGRTLRTTGFTAGTRLVTEEGEPVPVASLSFDSVLTVFPEGAVGRADSQTLLLRLPADVARPRPGRETWTVDGCVAYSKICTHAGCPVGLYDTATRELLCPCHQSLFDATDGARPVFGPATRSLPQLPLAVDAEGYLVAQSDYPEPVGPGYWDRP